MYKRWCQRECNVKLEIVTLSISRLENLLGDTGLKVVVWKIVTASRCKRGCYSTHQTYTGKVREVHLGEDILVFFPIWGKKSLGLLYRSGLRLVFSPFVSICKMIACLYCNLLNCKEVSFILINILFLYFTERNGKQKRKTGGS